jgi:hypothetical protein
MAASWAAAAPDEVSADPAPPAKGNNPSMQDVQHEMQGAISDLISTSGTIFSGMAAGMQEGAERGQAQLDGADGTRLIANKKDLAELVQVTVFKLEEQGSGSWRVTLAIRNANDFPVRLVNLTRKQSVLMLDADGFAYNPVPQQESARTLTVAARAAVKAAFDFSGLEAKPGIIRLFDTDFPVQ